MQLLLIRHAIALPRGTPDIPDDERPLTPEGVKKFEQAARGLASIVSRPDALWTSPLLRARHTAEIAATVWKKLAARELPALADGDFGGLAAALAELPADATAAAVGHEPHLSELLARLLGSKRAECLTFRKGGAALVELPGALAQGGTLLWFLPPKLLRRLAA
jgi:phosphohistidine phosphatase